MTTLGIEQLQREIAARRRLIDAIEAKERKEKNLPLVGKCFKYRNNYSCPKTPRDYWWLYIKVLSADGYKLKVIECQTDSNGTITIKPATTIFRTLSDGYQPCSAAEFNAAWRKVKNRVKALV